MNERNFRQQQRVCLQDLIKAEQVGKAIVRDLKGITALSITASGNTSLGHPTPIQSKAFLVAGEARHRGQIDVISGKNFEKPGGCQNLFCRHAIAFLKAPNSRGDDGSHLLVSPSIFK